MQFPKKQPTVKQKRMLEKAAQLATNAPVAITQHLFEIEDRLDNEISQIKDLLEQIPIGNNDSAPALYDTIEEVHNDLNKKLDTLAEEVKKKEEISFEIDPETIRGKKGDRGDDYILTPTDIDTIASLASKQVKIPIVEKIIEKTETIREELPKEVKDEIKKLRKDLEGVDFIAKKNAFNPTMGPSFADIQLLKNRLTNLETGVGDVLSVSNSDGTLTISPTVGAVVASLNLGHANTWTAQQTFNTTAPIFGTMTLGSVFFAGASGLLSQNNSKLFWDNTNFRLGIGTTSPQIPLDVSGSFRVGGVLTGTFPATGEGFEVAYGSASTGLDGVSTGLSIFQSFSRDASAWKDIWMRGREISFDVNGNQRMYLSNSANSFYLNGGVVAMILNSTGAGFGVTPSSPLDAQGLPSVDGNSRSVSRLVDTTAMAIDVGADLSFWGRFSSGGAIGNFASIGGRKENATDGNYASYLNFTTRVFGGSPTERMRITSVGNVGIGLTTVTASLHIKAGVAAANGAPLKFTAGTNLTSPELGAMEFTDNGTTGHLYITVNQAGVLTRVQII